MTYERDPSILLLAVGDKGLALLDAVGGRVDLRLVVTYPQAGSKGAQPDDFRERCEQLGCEVLESRRPSPDVFGRADLALAVGWQYRLDPPPDNLVVLHDSLLPRHRGFAPTVSALIAGDRAIGVTAIRPVDEIDAGPILAQEGVAIEPPVRIGEAFDLLSGAYERVATQVIDAWAAGETAGEAQDDSLATYSIWRDSEDLWIDWSWPADRVVRFVYAVGHPYGGARTAIAGEEIVVEDVREVADVPFVERHPGKVWRMDDDGPVVVCGEGLVRLTRMRSPDGTSYTVRRLRTRLRGRGDEASTRVDD